MSKPTALVVVPEATLWVRAAPGTEEKQKKKTGQEIRLIGGH